MKHPIFSTLFVITVGVTLSACLPKQNDAADSHYAICKELNRQIVLNGAVSPQDRDIDIQRAELGRLNQAYDSNHCSSEW